MKVEVQVIAAFNIDGEIQPLYIQYKGKTYKILSYFVSHEDIAWITFQCSIQIEDCARNVTLNYGISKHKWEMIIKY